METKQHTRTHPLRPATAPVADAHPIARVMEELRLKRRASRRLGALAVMMLVSGVVHTGVYFVDDRAWAGSLSWRKPIVFAFSFSLMLWAVGWVLDQLPKRRGTAIISWAVLVTSVLEVGLISAQTWRSQPSHFNVFESTDSLIFGLMGQAVMVLTLALGGLLIWTIIERPADPAIRIAAISGLLIMMTGLGVGSWMISLGNEYVEKFDAVPETVVHGAEGKPKFPHGIAFHGIHTFALVAACMKVGRVARNKQIQMMWVTVAAYTGVLVFSVVQTFAGRAPSDIVATSGTLLTVSTLTLTAVVARAFIAAVRPAITMNA